MEACEALGGGGGVHDEDTQVPLAGAKSVLNQAAALLLGGPAGASMPHYSWSPPVGPPHAPSFSATGNPLTTSPPAPLTAAVLVSCAV
jgi:hypothetical protein